MPRVSVGNGTFLALSKPQCALLAAGLNGAQKATAEQQRSLGVLVGLKLVARYADGRYELTPRGHVAATSLSPQRDALPKAVPEIEWWASSAKIARMGPYATQVLAWAALRVDKKTALASRRDHVPGAYVWPEEKKAT